MKQILSLFILGIVFLSSCKKENAQYDLCSTPAIDNSTCITDSNQLKTGILGKWDWTRTTGGFAPVLSTPCTDSINRSYEFLNNHVVKYYENGTFAKEGYYQVVGTSLHASDTASTFILNGEASICGDYLVIDAQPVDGYQVTLVRQ